VIAFAWISVPGIVLILLLVFGWAIPAFIIGRRRRVRRPGVAFVPIFGPWIVILRSIGRSGWLAALVPIYVVGFILGIWLAFKLPAEHERSRWWTLALAIPAVNLVGFYAYAFTLKEQVVAA
jgi:hypothetical protein